MINNKTLGPTTYPKRHLFLDIDNVVEWNLNVYQNFSKPERIETTGYVESDDGIRCTSNRVRPKTRPAFRSTTAFPQEENH